MESPYESNHTITSQGEVRLIRSPRAQLKLIGMCIYEYISGKAKTSHCCTRCTAYRFLKERLIFIRRQHYNSTVNLF